MPVIDQQLLQDIGPYSCAYGHTMSNYIYQYQQCSAYHTVFASETTRVLASYYERILRSFLVTKNISHSKKLVKEAMEKELGIEDLGALELPRLVPGSDEEKLVRAARDESCLCLRDIQDLLRKEKKLKSDLEIRAEYLSDCWPDSPICAALIRLLQTGKRQKAELDLGGIVFHLQLYRAKVNYREEFRIGFWRRAEDRRYVISKTSFELEIAAAKSMFPEILQAEWQDVQT